MAESNTALGWPEQYELVFWPKQFIERIETIERANAMMT